MCEIGTVILKENPLLSWTSNTWDEFFNKYLTLSQQKRQQILDMFVPHDNTKIIGKAMCHTKFLQENNYDHFHDLGSELIKKLIGIAVANSHSNSF
jgi:hypothetical protein